MAYDPLQAGDRLTTRGSSTDSSSAADRRSQVVGSVQSENGENRSGGSPASPEFKVGYLGNLLHRPPFDPVLCEGDTSGEGTKIYDIDVAAYGDSYDPTAPMRVRFADQWQMDSDHDGKLN
jgi:hypothetical protein